MSVKKFSCSKNENGYILPVVLILISFMALTIQDIASKFLNLQRAIENFQQINEQEVMKGELQTIIKNLIKYSSEKLRCLYILEKMPAANKVLQTCKIKFNNVSYDYLVYQLNQTSVISTKEKNLTKITQYYFVYFIQHSEDNNFLFMQALYK